MAGHGLIQQQQERRLRPHPERDLKCPRCASTNTKFCYYNNYSLSQPRYFCKGCRRYWTLGGSLRNVPVGGGCRKNKRSSSSSSSSSSSYYSKKAQELDLTSTPLLPTLIHPPLTYDPSDLTFRLQKQPPMVQFGLDDNSHNLNPALSAPAPTNGFLDTLGHGFLDITRPIGLNHLYHGYGVNGRLEEIGGENGGLGGATTGQGSCEAMDGGGDTKAFTGLAWQEGSMDSARDCWNGAVGSSLHGLINSSML